MPKIFGIHVVHYAFFFAGSNSVSVTLPVFKVVLHYSLLTPSTVSTAGFPHFRTGAVPDNSGTFPLLVFATSVERSI